MLARRATLQLALYEANMTSAATIQEQLHEAIANSIGGAQIDIRGGQGGHFELEVVSTAFEGLSTLERHRKVLSSIKELMAGDAAPVHAIDRLVARTP
jgi:stress-induced morphogen